MSNGCFDLSVSGKARLCKYCEFNSDVTKCEEFRKTYGMNNRASVKDFNKVFQWKPK